MAGFGSVSAAIKPPIAGYLPHYAPRFVSQAEQAATKLPPTIKAQSLKNALLRQGAKPVELEYAGIDDFIAQQGPTVSSADVLEHIKREGPLGQLKRVEQQDAGVPGGDWADHFPHPGKAPSIQAPFSEATAYPHAKYGQYTVPGKRGDFTGYREVLIEDPKNRPAGSSMELTPGQRASEDGPATPPVYDAHSADYWARYNEYPDRIALQNIQSDVGQAASGGGGGYTNGLNTRLGQVRHARRQVIADINNDAGLTPQRRAELQGEIHSLNEEEADIYGMAAEWGLRVYEKDGEEWFADSGPASPLAKDDNWKNLMARHIALQSIAGGGKPITIPTGKQMVDVEGFGMGTHGNATDAARAASSYNEDLVRRLQKIFRGLDPKGAEVSQSVQFEPTAGQAKFEPQVLLGPKSGGGFAAEPGDVWQSRVVPKSIYEDLMVEAGELVEQSLRRPSDSRNQGLYRQLHEIASAGPDGVEQWSTLSMPLGPGQQIVRYGDTLGQGRGWKDQEVWVSTPISDEQRIAAQRLLGRWHHALSSGREVTGYQTPRSPHEDAPGWTINPSPEAVRAALQNGLPIMSLAPLLLAPAQEER